jgi:hypothetical protein
MSCEFLKTVFFYWCWALKAKKKSPLIELFCVKGNNSPILTYHSISHKQTQIHITKYKRKMINHSIGVLVLFNLFEYVT